MLERQEESGDSSVFEIEDIKRAINFNNKYEKRI